ncbi:hypothetical protein ACFFX0_23635 [Citricoccus parietis]|uniref:Uncharacterized protein n=1 Tax=Citricoccus parietis TaxID=592307 RepID=A0ABV5G512_9MICC
MDAVQLECGHQLGWPPGGRGQGGWLWRGGLGLGHRTSLGPGVPRIRCGQPYQSSSHSRIRPPPRGSPSTARRASPTRGSSIGRRAGGPG